MIVAFIYIIVLVIIFNESITILEFTTLTELSQFSADVISFKTSLSTDKQFKQLVKQFLTDNAHLVL